MTESGKKNGTILAFLRARLDEDEAVPAVVQEVEYHLNSNPPKEVRDALSRRMSPSALLREVEAKRRIMDMLDGSPDFDDAMPAPRYARPYHSPSVDVLIRACQLLALPYDQHPDYDPSWRP